MGKKENVWIVVGVVVVLLVVGWWVMSKSSTTDNENYDETSETPTEDVSEGSVNSGTPAASISYQNALIKYKDARLQLDDTCQASPAKMTFKNGASMMVDNRSAVARTVKVGSVFPIKAYGFKIVQLSSATLPATWLVDCDKSQNVATILIQK